MSLEELAGGRAPGAQDPLGPREPPQCLPTEPPVTRRLTRALIASAIALAVAAALVPLTARSACACRNPLLSYRAAMKLDLRNMVTAQEAFIHESGRFGSVDELIAGRHFRFSTGVHLVESRVSDSAYAVRVRHEQLSEPTCEIVVRSDGPPDVELVCGRFPRERAHTRNGIIFFVLLSIALALHFGQAAAGTRGFLSKRLLLVPLLALAHPFWDVIQDSVIDHCNLLDLDLIWIAFAVATAWYLFLGPNAPPAPGSGSGFDPRTQSSP